MGASKAFRAFVLGFLLVFCSSLCPAQNLASDLLRDLARLKQESNPARMKVLEEILRERGIPYELQTFESKPSPHGRTEGKNIVIALGEGPREITVGAHYDALELEGGGMIDGMVDNGAATIILVRAAEVLKNRSLRHRVRLVLYDMEETGLIGSRAYVAAHKSGIVAAINLDVTAFGDAVALSPGKAPGTAKIDKAIMLTCTEQRLTCLEFQNFPPSDDRSFKDAGIPVVSIALAPKATIYQFWEFFNSGEQSGQRTEFMPEAFKIIHTPEDNIGKIEPAALELGFRLLVDSVVKLDESLY